jgi:iron-regulated transporter 1
VPALRDGAADPDDQEQGEQMGMIDQEQPLNQDSSSWLKTAAYRILPLTSLPYYFRHPAFLPSFSLSLLYLTVLSLSGQMLTYLISVGYTSLHIGIIRTVSTIFELSATWIAPRLMRRIGVVRCGIWSLSWQMIWLTAGVSWFSLGFWGHATSPLISAAGLVVGVAFSRAGLWSYDLCAQSIIQDVT